VVSVLDSFLEQRRGAVGVAPRAGWRQSRSGATFGYGKNGENGQGGEGGRA
jgi:hypothetical protein